MRIFSRLLNLVSLEIDPSYNNNNWSKFRKYFFAIFKNS
jgi:hypothetical protein